MNGVNAYITQHKDHLPIEFLVTGLTPEPWTIEQVVLRPPTFGDASAELQLARNVARLGVEAANRAANPDPPDDLRVPDGLDPAAIGDEAIASLRAGGAGGGAVLPPLLPQFREDAQPGRDDSAIREPGSNNWVVGPSRSATGHPVVANDPHREVTNPSLRYIVHLQAPGWNVIGAGEPPFVGVAVGHNERVGWGLTIVGTDQEDVYVEQVNPANANEVKFNGAWEPLRIVRDTIKVKDSRDEIVELKFSRHGPVFFEDATRHLAYAIRRAAAEPGTAPYLGGLRLAQTRDCREFLDAAMYWKAPTENLICGDVADNISWRPSALSPARQGWTGRLPVPGTGAYEWRGFRKDLPEELNPSRGYIATANNNILPPGYTVPLGYEWALPFRFHRIEEMLQVRKKFSIEDFERMQQDVTSLPARRFQAVLRSWTPAAGSREAKAADLVLQWDANLAIDSAPALIYEYWIAQLPGALFDTDIGPDVSLETLLDTLEKHPNPKALGQSLRAALGEIEHQFGPDMHSWQWGKIHQIHFRHPLGVQSFNRGPVARPGDANTVNATSGAHLQQTNGASYREILDLSDWDRSVMTNVPGESGDPDSSHYSDLLDDWASGRYHPMPFSRPAVEAAAAEHLWLVPRANSGTP